MPRAKFVPDISTEVVTGERDQDEDEEEADSRATSQRRSNVQWICWPRHSMTWRTLWTPCTTGWARSRRHMGHHVKKANNWWLPASSTSGTGSCFLLVCLRQDVAVDVVRPAAKSGSRGFSTAIDLVTCWMELRFVWHKSNHETNIIARSLKDKHTSPPCCYLLPLFTCVLSRMSRTHLNDELSYRWWPGGWTTTWFCCMHENCRVRPCRVLSVSSLVLESPCLAKLFLLFQVAFAEACTKSAICFLVGVVRSWPHVDGLEHCSQIR